MKILTLEVEVSDDQMAILTRAVATGVNQTPTPEALLRVGAIEKLDDLTRKDAELGTAARQTVAEAIPSQHLGAVLDALKLMAAAPAEKQGDIAKKLLELQAVAR